jgi:hypothetical protein
VGRMQGSTKPAGRRLVVGLRPSMSRNLQFKAGTASRADSRPHGGRIPGHTCRAGASPAAWGTQTRTKGIELKRVGRCV